MSEKYLTLYRKYRPQSYEDVVGQEQIVTLLTTSIAKKTVSHAYLFCGGRGTGKTTVARIFATSLGCNPEDIIEIDAASNRGIDEIRELRNAVRTAPFSSPYKVYIIDEAHMLTKEAANAFLKTLEEPPAHVIFIFATTDPEKLPATIISRCQKITFRSPDVETLSKRIIHVSLKEGKVISQESANLVAIHGKGSYRDALGVLEQVLSLSEKDIAHADVLRILGIPERESIMNILRACGNKDIHLLTSTVLTLEKEDKDALIVYDTILESIRGALLIRTGNHTSTSEEDATKLASLATEYPYFISSKTILYLLEKRHLLEVSKAHSWSAAMAILLSLLTD